jgi:hypothetical protein
LRRQQTIAESAAAERAAAKRLHEFAEWALHLKGRLVDVRYRELSDKGYSEYFSAVISLVNYWPGCAAGEIHIKFTGDNWCDTQEFKDREDFDSKVVFID